MMSSEIVLPITPKQLAYARSLAVRNGVVLPWAALSDRITLSRWIEAQEAARPANGNMPTSKQVAFAERIARLKRRTVPDECFRDRQLLSRWIDSNK